MSQQKEQLNGDDERRLWLSRQLSAPVSLAWTENRSVMISVKGDAISGYQLRIQQLFRQAPGTMWRALVVHVQGTDTGASDSLRQYVRRHQNLLNSRRQRRPHARSLKPRGQYFDLEAIYQLLNRDYFGNHVQARITWGRRPPTRQRRSIRFGVYDSRERLIRIHPLLDQAFVPAYVIESIVFHEMLHQLYPPRRINGRRLIHTPAFRSAERQFLHFEQAEAWQRQYVGRLLRD